MHIIKRKYIYEFCGRTNTGTSTISHRTLAPHTLAPHTRTDYLKLILRLQVGDCCAPLRGIESPGGGGDSNLSDAEEEEDEDVGDRKDGIDGMDMSYEGGLLLRGGRVGVSTRGGGWGAEGATIVRGGVGATM